MTRGSARARELYRLLRGRLRSYRRAASLWGEPGLLAPAIRRMAETDSAADRRLEHDCLPISVHYYSPGPERSMAGVAGRHRPVEVAESRG